LPFTRTVAVHFPPEPSCIVVGPEIMTCIVGEGVGVGVGVGVNVGLGVGLIIEADADGFADADAAAFVVAFAVFVAALGAVVETLLAASLLLVDDVQPAARIAATIIISEITATFFIMYLT